MSSFSGFCDWVKQTENITAAARTNLLIYIEQGNH